MSAPPLPDTFGNYALGDFAEIVAPPGISWLPQTDGWWLVAAVLAAFGLRHSWRGLRHWYRNRYRREAGQRLQAIAANASSDSLVAELNRLLKLAALAAFERSDVAALSGMPWVEFLNSRCPQPVFDDEQAELLALGVYRPRPLDENVRTGLVTACNQWINSHNNGHDD